MPLFSGKKGFNGKNDGRILWAPFAVVNGLEEISELESKDFAAVKAISRLGNGKETLEDILWKPPTMGSRGIKISPTKIVKGCDVPMRAVRREGHGTWIRAIPEGKERGSQTLGLLVHNDVNAFIGMCQGNFDVF
jgi:hypothetical protein